MECPMCYDLYDTLQKNPRNLNCGHTVCEQCLGIVYQKKKFLDCPTCRFKHDPQTKPNMLSKNFVALQLACQKKESRKNQQFCTQHDEPIKFFCETDGKYICVECISAHTGHLFTKQDQSFFAAKKKLNTEIERLDTDRASLVKCESNYTYVKQELIHSYKESVDQLDHIFNTIKTKLSDEHTRSKEELNQFLEKEIEELEVNEKELIVDLDYNSKERARIVTQLEKIEREKKAQEEFVIEEVNSRTHKRPTVVEFPVLVMPFTGNQSFIQICHKVTPKICFFGQRKKILTLCPLTNCYSLTTINNCQIQYYASACTLPTGEIFITGGGSSSSCFLYSPRDQNVLEKKKPMNFARKEHSCVYLNGKVYVISGYDGKNKGMAGCQAYDIFNEDWKPVKGLNTPRCAFAAIVCNGKIYVFGGYDGKERLSTIQVYTPQNNKWTILSAKLFFPLSNAAAVSEGRYIYVLGGGWSQGFNQEVFQFNIDSHELVYFQKMNKGRDLRNKAIKFQNQIYTIGGNCSDGEKLDLREKKWQSLKPYNDLVNDNLDSWCCALSYNSHEYELKKYQQMSKILKRKYKDSSLCKTEDDQ